MIHRHSLSHVYRYAVYCRSAATIAAVLPLLACGACASRETFTCDGPPAAASSVERSSQPASAPPKSSWRTIESAGKRYVVAYQTTPTEIPLNQPFSMEVRVFAGEDRNSPLTDVSLSFDAAMPEHSHGMNRLPRVQKLEDRFVIDNILLHMSGAWQMYFDVKRGNVSERALVNLELE